VATIRKRPEGRLPSARSQDKRPEIQPQQRGPRKHADVLQKHDRCLEKDRSDEPARKPVKSRVGKIKRQLTPRSLPHHSSHLSFPLPVFYGFRCSRRKRYIATEKVLLRDSPIAKVDRNGVGQCTSDHRMARARAGIVWSSVRSQENAALRRGKQTGCRGHTRKGR